MESADKIVQTTSSVNIRGTVYTGRDGIDIELPGAVDIGVAYQRDWLFPPHRVNPQEGGIGIPNAYLLPLANPYGDPSFDLNTETGVFLWKDEGGTWHFRATADNGYMRYVGNIVPTYQPLL